MSGKFGGGILWLLTMCLGTYLLVNGMLYLRNDSSGGVKKVLGTLCENVQEQAFVICFPQYMVWEDSLEPSSTEMIMTYISPLTQFIYHNMVRETAMEDNQISDEIVRLHNKLLADEVLLENQEEIFQEENQGTEDDTEQILPTWAQISENPAEGIVSMERLQNFDYLLQDFFVVDSDTTVPRNMFTVDQLLGANMKMVKKEGPQILIYHTHSQEEYVDSVEGDENTTVVGVGNYLEYLLETYFGYEVLHIKDAFDMVEGKLERSHAYNYALPVLEEVLQEYPSVEVIIDLHRDGVAQDRHLVTEVNGKPTAQIMFFNGTSRKSSGEERTSLPNAYVTDNISFSFQLAFAAEQYYPGFTRCVYLKGYRYNLHLRPKSILLEVGAQTNTVEEAKNAMEPFSVILNKVLNGE